jgi:hypothetical protein
MIYTSPYVWMLGHPPPLKKQRNHQSHKHSHLIHYFKQKQKQKSGQHKNLVKKKSYIHLLVSNILKS